MKIAIIGSNGQLGSDLCEYLKNNEIIPLTHKDIEIKNQIECISILNDIKPDIVINTAAFHNVPLCETEKEEALRVNTVAPFNLSLACNQINAELVHFSTDYVFDGVKKKPYKEDDTPNPLNFYGISKLAGEYSVKAYCKKYKIIRVSGIYGKIPSRAKGSNFITSMIKLSKEKNELKVVNDEIIAPSNTEDIAKQVEKLLEFKQETGIFHISNDGQCTWFEFASAIFEFLNNDIKISPIKSIDFPSNLKRPSFSIIENEHIKKLGIYGMRHWKDALKEHIYNYYR